MVVRVEVGGGGPMTREWDNISLERARTAPLQMSHANPFIIPGDTGMLIRDKERERRLREQARSNMVSRSLADRAVDGRLPLSALARGLVSAGGCETEVQGSKRQRQATGGVPRMRNFVVDQREVYRGQLVIDHEHDSLVRMRDDILRQEQALDKEMEKLENAAEVLKQNQARVERELAAARVRADRAMRERLDCLRRQKKLEVIVGDWHKAIEASRERLEKSRSYRALLTDLFGDVVPSDASAVLAAFEHMNQENRSLLDWAERFEELERSKTANAQGDVRVTRGMFERVDGKIERLPRLVVDMPDVSGEVADSGAEVERVRALVLRSYVRLIGGYPVIGTMEALLAMSRELDALLLSEARLDPAVMKERRIRLEKARRLRTREQAQAARQKAWAEKLARTHQRATQVIIRVPQRPLRPMTMMGRPSTRPRVPVVRPSEQRVASLLWGENYGD